MQQKEPCIMMPVYKTLWKTKELTNYWKMSLHGLQELLVNSSLCSLFSSFELYDSTIQEEIP